MFLYLKNFYSNKIWEDVHLLQRSTEYIFLPGDTV